MAARRAVDSLMPASEALPEISSRPLSMAVSAFSRSASAASMSVKTSGKRFASQQ